MRRWGRELMPTDCLFERPAAVARPLTSPFRTEYIVPFSAQASCTSGFVGHPMAFWGDNGTLVEKATATRSLEARLLGGERGKNATLSCKPNNLGERSMPCMCERGRWWVLLTLPDDTYRVPW